MTRNTNFDDVRVGSVVGFDVGPESFTVIEVEPHRCVVIGATGRRLFVHKGGSWEKDGGYIISQPDEAPTEQPHALPVEGTYAWHIQDVSTDPEAPPYARFEMMFDEGWKPEHIAAVLTYLGIETKLLSEDWPESVDDEPLTRANVKAVELPAWAEEGGWTLATAWDTEDSEIMMRFVRPAIDAAMDREARG